MQRPVLPTVSNLFSKFEIQNSKLRVAVLDSVVNSENTGAIFRAAAALGIDAVLLTRTCCDPLNRRACRVSMGTVFQLPWTFLDHYMQLKECGFQTVAMALTDRSVPIDDASLRGIDRMAIILGTEGDGLSDSVLRQCDHVARIPMQRGVDSLNVAAAAAVAFYELTK
jgi:tRNA G18 (ribose-2'-O)-methylase SpoU